MFVGTLTLNVENNVHNSYLLLFLNAFDYLFDICVHLTITDALAHVGGTDYNPPV